MKALTPLEDQVITMLLAGNDESLAVLREQIKQAEVTSRKPTGVGFYTHFAVPSEAPRLAVRSSFRLSDLQGTATNVEHGIGFILYVEDGKLSMLEGYTYDDAWPEKIEGLFLSYSGQAEKSRDMDKVRRVIHSGCR